MIGTLCHDFKATRTECVGMRRSMDLCKYWMVINLPHCSGNKISHLLLSQAPGDGMQGLPMVVFTSVSF